MNDERIHDAAKFIHEMVGFGLSAKEIKDGLLTFYQLRLNQRGVLKVSKLPVPKAAEAIRQSLSGKRTRDAEWIQ